MQISDLIFRNVKLCNDTFLTEEKPYWFDLSDVLLEFQDLMKVANSTLMAAGSEWMNETLQEDQIQTFSRANENTVS